MNTEKTFTIQARDDLGNDNPGATLAANLTPAEMWAWLDAHEDEGTYEVIDDRDGRPACGYDTGEAGGAWACDCGRCAGERAA